MSNFTYHNPTRLAPKGRDQKDRVNKTFFGKFYHSSVKKHDHKSDHGLNIQFQDQKKINTSVKNLAYSIKIKYFEGPTICKIKETRWKRKMSHYATLHSLLDWH